MRRLASAVGNTLTLTNNIIMSHTTGVSITNGIIVSVTFNVFFVGPVNVAVTLGTTPALPMFTVQELPFAVQPLH